MSDPYQSKAEEEVLAWDGTIIDKSDVETRN